MPTGLGNFMFSNSCNFRGWRYFWVNLKIKPKREAELERKIKEVLKKVFGYEKFRENQKEIILNILKKRDVLADISTGLGNFMFSLLQF